VAYADRGPWHPGRKDPPLSCPSCGRALEAGPMAGGMVGVCGHEECPEWVVLFRLLEGRPHIAERIARQSLQTAAGAIAGNVAG
jgi:hypothetical protein